MHDSKELWNSVLLEIEMSTSKANFSTWFKNTGIYKIEDDIVHVGVPNEFVKDWLNQKYQKSILKTLRNISPTFRGIEFFVIKDANKQQIKQIPIALNINKELPLEDLYINKEDNLNPKYTFESFIVGSFNQLAYAASQTIISRPGVAYNPFFVYGGTGLGKTHLIQSIGNFLRTKIGKKVFYTTLEKFSMDYVNAMQNNNINQFKEKYRKYDVLIMDDIQFIGTKEKTQDELFFLFNVLYENNKQIIFSSDKHPNFIPGLEDRLRSRFSVGMTVDISQPEYESRLAILKTKTDLNHIPVSEEVLSYIATTIQSNIRELEGALNSLVCQTQLKGRAINLNEAKQLIKNNIKPKKNMVIKDIVKIIADYYNIEEESIYEKNRKKEVVRPRQIAMYILREDFSISYPSIGEKMGGRDHTTVIHSYDKIKNEMKDNMILSQEIEQLRTLF